ncbi:probable carboxylesterase 8 [Tanacetum coccineum]
MTNPKSSSDTNTFFRLAQNSDGSVTRISKIPSLPATPERTSESQLTLSKDIPLNTTNKTFQRLFRPVLEPRTNGKLPIIIYFHGGGFVFYSATSFTFHKFCSAVSAHTPAVVISVEYRLAPEHRLPAAYDDSMEALLWVRDQALGINGCDDWLSELADFSRVFLMGSSSGGNIVYNAGLRALDLDLHPIKIAGLIMNQIYFGGVESTQSELQLANDRILPLHANHVMWSLALPEGCDRDHKYSNPLQDKDISRNGNIIQLPKCLVIGYSGDPLVDRQRAFATMLEACGVQVIKKFENEGYHIVEFFDPQKAKLLYDEIKSFISSLEKKMSNL